MTQMWLSERVVVILLCCLYFGQCAVHEYDVDPSQFTYTNPYSSSMTADEVAQGNATLTTIHKYCTPLQVSTVLRHGIRNPADIDINSFGSILSRVSNTPFTSPQLDELKEVAAQFPLAQANNLVDAGIQEHRGLGYRMMETFSTLLKDVGVNDVSFSATSSSRAIGSGQGFQKGFFTDHGRDITVNITTRNDLLQYFVLCQAYVEQQKKPGTTYEYVKFQNATFAGIASRYFDAAGLPFVKTTPGELTNLYNMGTLEYAILNTTRVCEYFKPEDLSQVEYSEDLRLFYVLGNGFSINAQMACPLVAEIFHNMDSVKSSTPSYKKGLFYFGHAETIIPLAGLLELFKDSTPLTADNYAQQTNRAFKTGKIAPFSANIGFVQYSCDLDAIAKDKASIPDGIFPTEQDKSQTLMLFNEMPMKYPFCSSFLCPYATVRAHYAKIIDGCNFEQVCKVDASTVAPQTTMKSHAIGTSSSVVLLMMATILLLLLK